MELDNDISENIEQQLKEIISEDVIEKALSTLKVRSLDFINSIIEQVSEEMKGYYIENLMFFVNQMAEEAVKAMLKGDEKTMRFYLSCRSGFNGRSDGYEAYRGQNTESPYHRVIRGNFHENSAIEIRRLVASANENLLRDERIKDLEDIVTSLTLQVKQAESKLQENYTFFN